LPILPELENRLPILPVVHMTFGCPHRALWLLWRDGASGHTWLWASGEMFSFKMFSWGWLSE